MAVDWFYIRAGQIVGPLTAAELREHALAQKVSPTDLVRRGSDGDWSSASRVKGLFGLTPAETLPVGSPTAPPVQATPNEVTQAVPQTPSGNQSQSASASAGVSVPLGWVVAGAVALIAVFAFLYMNHRGGHGGSPRGSKLTADNFRKIYPGMNHQEVTLILGQPTTKEGSIEAGFRIWTWREGSKEITVVIDNDGNVMAHGASAAKTQKGLN